MSAMGSQVDDQTNDGPNRLSAGHAPVTRTLSITTIISGSPSAIAVRMRWYVRSLRPVVSNPDQRVSVLGFGVGTGSMGRLVIARETYRRPTGCPSRRCNGIVTAKWLASRCRTAHREAALCDGLRCYSALKTGRPPAVTAFKRAWIQGRSSLGSGA